MFSVLIFMVFSCVKTHKGPIENQQLVLLATYPLDIEGPSGLSNSYLPGHFYTVCDKKGSIYLINDTGEILLTMPIGGDDLEGVEYVAETQKLYVIEEKLRLVLKLTAGGKILDTFKLDIPAQNINDGPEGIAYNPQKKQFYIVNQRNPAILFVYDTLFTEQARYPLNFANDYSSLDYEGGYLWILSQKSHILARCDLQGKPDQIFDTGVPDGEGLVVDLENNRVYIVCDDNSTLYVFMFEMEQK